MATAHEHSSSAATDNGSQEEDYSRRIQSDHSRDPGADLLKQRLLLKHEELDVDKYFRALVKLEGSDLHMKVGRPPMIRTRNELRPLNRPPIEAEEMMDLLLPMMNERNKKIFYEEGGGGSASTCSSSLARSAWSRGG
jgi:twitching motility protein PilT